MRTYPTSAWSASDATPASTTHALRNACLHCFQLTMSFSTGRREAVRSAPSSWGQESCHTTFRLSGHRSGRSATPSDINSALQNAKFMIKKGNF